MLGVPATLKDPVDLRPLTPPMVVAWMHWCLILSSRGVPAVMTCGAEGEHRSPNTLHPSGNALDFRLPSYYTRRAEDDGDAASELRASLSVQYDVVLEETHVHVEFQPKEPAPGGVT